MTEESEESKRKMSATVLELLEFGSKFRFVTEFFLKDSRQQHLWQLSKEKRIAYVSIHFLHSDAFGSRYIVQLADRKSNERFFFLHDGEVTVELQTIEERSGMIAKSIFSVTCKNEI